METLHLILHFATITAWLAFVPFLWINRRIMPVNIFYLMLLSSFLTAYCLIAEFARHDYNMSWNTWQWYPTNIIATYTYYWIVRGYSRRYARIKCWVPKLLKSKK